MYRVIILLRQTHLRFFIFIFLRVFLMNKFSIQNHIPDSDDLANETLFLLY